MSVSDQFCIEQARTMDDNNKLQDFAARALAKGRITFGDVRRLQRDYLPEGLSSIEETRVVLSLDGSIERADRAWSNWLVAAVVDFVARSEEAAFVDENSIDAWLQDAFTISGASPGVRRRITRELRRDVQRSQQIAPFEGEAPAHIVVPDAPARAVGEIPLAA
jgi:hypothetical protein